VGRASGLFCCLLVGGRTIGSTSDSGTESAFLDPFRIGRLNEDKEFTF
jgi:hypothetical protein